MSLWWGSDPFAELVAKATSELLPAGQEDIALNLEICDQVRAKQVQPKQAMQAIKKRINDSNPNVVLLALGLTDICIKNGGDHFLAQVASREFMDNLVSVLKKPSGVNHDVKTKALALIQDWAQISEAKPAQMGYIVEIYRTLKSDRSFDFPAKNTTASAAFVETLTAPEWVDGDVCMRCRTQFTTFNRKHHCRNCGNVFCQQCSSHTMSLAWYGVGQDVRVCDGCFAKKAPPKVPASAGSAKLNRSASSTSSSVYPSGRGGSGSGSSSHHRSATLGSKPRRSKREDDDLALAIKLSLQDGGGSGGSAPGSSTYNRVSSPSQPSPAAQRATRQPNGRMLEGTDADDDPDLAAAIAASLRDYAPPQPSAPTGFDDDDDGVVRSGTPPAAVAQPPQSTTLPLPPSLDLPPSDVDSLLTFAQTVRQQDEQQRHHGSPAAPPSHQAQALYHKAASARPKMARSLDEAARRRGVLLSMHDKLTEAVKLYDGLLDAQMSRPADASYATYGHPQHPQQQMAPYPPGSPDPFVHQRQYGAFHQQQQQQYAQPNGYGVAASASPEHAGNSAGAPMYPSLPSGSAAAAPPTPYHQEPQQTGASMHSNPSIGGQHHLHQQQQQHPYQYQPYVQSPAPAPAAAPSAHTVPQPFSPSRSVGAPQSPSQSRLPSLTPGEVTSPNALGAAVYQQQDVAASQWAAGGEAPMAAPYASPHLPSNGPAQQPVYDYAQFAPQPQPQPQQQSVTAPSSTTSPTDLNHFQRLMSPGSETPTTTTTTTTTAGGVKVAAGIGAHGGVYEPGQGPQAQPFANSLAVGGGANSAEGDAQQQQQQRQQPNHAQPDHVQPSNHAQQALAALPSAPTSLPDWQQQRSEGKTSEPAVAEAPALIEL